MLFFSQLWFSTMQIQLRFIFLTVNVRKGSLGHLRCRMELRCRMGRYMKKVENHWFKAKTFMHKK